MADVRVSADGVCRWRRISVERDLLGGCRKEERCEPSVCEVPGRLPGTGRRAHHRQLKPQQAKPVRCPSACRDSPQTSGLPLSGQEERAPPLHRQKTRSGRLAGTRSLTVALWGHRAGLGRGL